MSPTLQCPGKRITMTQEAIQHQIDVIRKVGEMTRGREASRQFLIDAGIIQEKVTSKTTAAKTTAAKKTGPDKAAAKKKKAAKRKTN